MDYVKIGKVKNTHGLDGKLTIEHILQGKNPFQKIKHVFIEINRSSFIPYFLESKSIFSENEILVAFDDILVVEEARLLLNKSVYLEEPIFNQLKPLHVTADVVGFMIQDKTHGILGKIESLVETPKQVIASTTFKEKEILIPLVEDVISQIDINKKLILVDLPEGLLEIYLGS